MGYKKPKIPDYHISLSFEIKLFWLIPYTSIYHQVLCWAFKIYAPYGVGRQECYIPHPSLDLITLYKVCLTLCFSSYLSKYSLFLPFISAFHISDYISSLLEQKYHEIWHSISCLIMSWLAVNFDNTLYSRRCCKTIWQLVYVCW
jgi:hypothetical protein